MYIKKPQSKNPTRIITYTL